MGLIGREIIQTREYIDPTAKQPILNHKEIFPITVFEAVRESMDDAKSTTLAEVLARIDQSLRNKQPIFKAMPANYLMTFAGEAGAVGSIKISTSIPWDKDKQSDEKIPTEKAVGDLMFKLGLVDEDGNIIDESKGKRVNWSDIIGRPFAYSTTGDNEDGFMTQKCVTNLINDLSIKINDIIDSADSSISMMNTALTRHIDHKDNPHNVTVEQIGAVSDSIFQFHLEIENPHHITKELLGLENVENTSDLDKPISKATQEALDKINKFIESISDNVDSLRYIVDIEYEQSTGKLRIVFNDESEIFALIPIDGLVNEVKFNSETKELVTIDLSGEKKNISLYDLFFKYIGSENNEIIISIEENEDHEKQIIHAIIKDDVITTKHIENNAVTNEKIADNAITNSKIQTNSIDSSKISDYAITSGKLADRSVTPRSMFTSLSDNKVLISYEPNSNPIWGTINEYMIDSDSIGKNHIKSLSIDTSKIIDESITSSKIANNAITNEKLSNYSVNTENLTNDSITSQKLSKDLNLPGTPSLEIRPTIDSDNNQLVDTHWVREFLSGYTFNDMKITGRVVQPSNLFSSNERNRVLIVKKPNTDPTWGKIIREMIEDGIVDNSLLGNKSVTTEKIKPFNITSNLIAFKSITSDHILNEAITPEKLFKAPGSGYILGSINESGIPIYTKVDQTMIADASISNRAIQDGAITMDKLAFPESSAHTVFGVNTKAGGAHWTKISNPMMNDRIVDARVLFTSDTGNKVLVVDYPETDPYWGQINSDMIKSFAIKREHITPGIIDEEHIVDHAIHTRHYMDYSITPDKIAPRAVTGDKIFSSTEDFRILAVTEALSSPVWIEFTDQFLASRSIGLDKLETSHVDYTVLGVKKAETTPSYVRITSNFIETSAVTNEKLSMDSVTTDKIVDENITTAKIANTSITESKIASDAVTTSKIKNLNITTEKIADSAITTPKIKNLSIITSKIADLAVTTEKIINYAINETKLASDSVITEKIKNYNVTTEKLAEKAVTNQKLDDNSISTNKIQNLAVTTEKIANEAITSGKIKDENILTEKLAPYAVTTEKIKRGAVTSDKIVRNVELSGTPSLTTPPIYTSNDYSIANTSWVITHITDLINELVLSSGSIEGDNIVNESITTEKIHNRAITGDKLFTSNVAPRVLGVEIANENPHYITIGTSLIDDKAVTSEKLNDNLKLRGIPTIENSPSDESDNHEIPDTAWVRKFVDIWNPFNKSGSSDETDDSRFVTGEFIFTSQDKDQVLVVNEANSDPVWSKIDTNKLKDESITSEKIKKDIQLPGTPTIETRPADDANNTQIPDTAWVLNAIDTNNPFKSEDGSEDNRFVTEKFLFTSKEDNRVLTVHTKDTDPAWSQINTDMMEDSSITSEKIADSVELPGAPSLKNRPPIDACDENENGKLIPDCQWVLDRINEHVWELEEQLKKFWGYGVLDEVVNNIEITAFNNTIPDDIGGTEKKLNSTSEASYYKLNKAFVVSDKFVSNIHNRAFNESIPPAGGEELPIESVIDKLDIIEGNDLYLFSDRVLSNIFSQAYNATHYDDTETDKRILPTSEDDYTLLLQKNSSEANKDTYQVNNTQRNVTESVMTIMMRQIQMMSQKIESLENEIKELKNQ